MAKVEVNGEVIIVGCEPDGSFKVVDTVQNTHMADDTAEAICDLCSAPLGMLKEIKHTVSPETISRAVKKGYRPNNVIAKVEQILKDGGISDHETRKEYLEDTIKKWKQLVDMSESLWALCDDCNVEIIAIIEAKEEKKRNET